MASDDFDGYFLAEVQGWLDKLGDRDFYIDSIIVTTGQWRSYDVRWEKKGRVLYVDFYSVARHNGVRMPKELKKIVCE